MENSIISWLEDKRRKSNLKLQSVPIHKIDKWNVFDSKIEHVTKGYFSIIGIAVNSDNPQLSNQPIIYQPEIGILGFIMKRNESDIQILIQAKTEPGNVGGTQIAPTVQATFSNYTQVHKGTPTKYLDYFLKNCKIDEEGILQSEQGTRFLSKYNRNISLFVEEHEIVHLENENWNWASTKELFDLMDKDFFINTDSRSVLVCSNWHQLTIHPPFEKNDNKSDFRFKLLNSFYSDSSIEQNTINDLIQKLQYSRRKHQFTIQKIPFSMLDGWEMNALGIIKKDVFSVYAFDIQVDGREVPFWSQPFLQSLKNEIVILYCQKINSILHFLISHSIEIGFAECLQFGPSIQQKAQDDPLEPDMKFIDSNSMLIVKFSQSDEGGRFYHSIVEYQLKEILVNDPLMLNNSKYCWMTLKQIKELLKVKGMFNNEFRSVLSLILKFI